MGGEWESSVDEELWGRNTNTKGFLKKAIWKPNTIKASYNTLEKRVLMELLSNEVAIPQLDNHKLATKNSRIRNGSPLLEQVELHRSSNIIGYCHWS